MRTMVIFLPVLLFFGCGAKAFEITKLNDKFYSADKLSCSIGKNNRITSLSTHGGTHIDDKGIYFEPYICKHHSNGELINIGFDFVHRAFERRDGFNRLREAIFLTDKGERVSIIFTQHSSDSKIHGWNDISNSFSSGYLETATSKIQKEDFVKLSRSLSIEVKLIGSNRTMIIKAEKVSKSFLSNLRKFAESEL